MKTELDIPCNTSDIRPEKVFWGRVIDLRQAYWRRCSPEPQPYFLGDKTFLFDAVIDEIYGQPEANGQQWNKLFRIIRQRYHEYLASSPPLSDENQLVLLEIRHSCGSNAFLLGQLEDSNSDSPTLNLDSMYQYKAHALWAFSQFQESF